MDFEQVLKEVLWRLVTEGSISYRRIKRRFGLDDDTLEDVRRELIGALHIATDLDGEFLVWAPDGRAAPPEPMALLQPLPALRRAEKPTAPAAARDLPVAAPVSSAPVAPAAVAAASCATPRRPLALANGRRKLALNYHSRRTLPPKRSARATCRKWGGCCPTGRFDGLNETSILRLPQRGGLSRQFRVALLG